MRRIALAALIAAFAMGPVLAQAPAPAPAPAPAGDSCETKAVSKDGKPLAGAAKRSAMAKCKREACLPKAVGSDGKVLRGAARNQLHDQMHEGDGLAAQGGSAPVRLRLAGQGTVGGHLDHLDRIWIGSPNLPWQRDRSTVSIPQPAARPCAPPTRSGGSSVSRKLHLAGSRHRDRQAVAIEQAVAGQRRQPRAGREDARRD